MREIPGNARFWLGTRRPRPTFLNCSIRKSKCSPYWAICGSESKSGFKSTFSSPAGVSGAVESLEPEAWGRILASERIAWKGNLRDAGVVGRRWGRLAGSFMEV